MKKMAQSLMSEEGVNRIPSLISVCLIIDVALCVLYLCNVYAGHPIWIVTQLLDLNVEASLSSWYSSIQYFAAFTFSAIFSFFMIKHHGKSLLLLLLPALFLLMSIDETAMIHEWVGAKSDALLPSGTRAYTTFDHTGIWVFVVGIPFLAFLVPFFYFIKKQLADHRSELLKLMAGMLIMLSGALLLELSGNFINVNFYFIEVVLEEGFEMVGATVMTWAVYNMMMTSGALNYLSRQH